MAAPIEERICHELKRIADALEMFLEQVLPLETPEPEPTTCPHPEDLQQDLGTGPDGLPEWVCGVLTCRHHHNPSS